MNKMVKRVPILPLAGALLTGCAGKQSVSESGTEAVSETAISYTQISQEEAEEMMSVDRTAVRQVLLCTGELPGQEFYEIKESIIFIE